MEHPRKLRLVDEGGSPLGERIEDALTSLVPRFQRDFPAFLDESLLIEVLEEAGRKIAKREAGGARIDNCYAYAWVTLRSIGRTWARAGSGRLTANTLGAQSSAKVLGGLPAKFGTAEQIERHILFREVLDRLTPEERLVCIWKKAGFSSQEIADHRGTSAGAVDTLFSRIRQKIRDLFRLRRGPAGQPPAVGPDDQVGAQFSSRDGAESENPDGD